MQDDPSPGFDCISYRGKYRDVIFPVRLDWRDPWLDDDWLKRNGLLFLEELQKRNLLGRYFDKPRTLSKVKDDYQFFVADLSAPKGFL